MDNYKEALEKIEKLEIFEDNWLDLLKVHSSFARYSENNKLLIFSQMPGATLVGKFPYWKKLGRNVKKGEKAIKIFAPIIRKKDDASEAEEIKGFFLTPVFDVSQTDGEDLPSVPTDTSKLLEQIIEGFENEVEEPIVYDSDSKYETGIFDGGFIVIKHKRDDETNIQNIVKGYVDYKIEKLRLSDEFPGIKNRDLYTVLSESVSFVVANHFNFKNIKANISPELLGDKKMLKELSPYVGKLSSGIIKMVNKGLKEES